MKTMKTNTLLVPLLAMAFLVSVGFASAGEIASGINTEFNGVDLSSGSNLISVAPGEIIPVQVTFEALEDLSDVEVKVSIEGSDEDVSDESAKFDIIDGVIYTKHLKLQMPSDVDSATEDEYTLYVEIVSKTDKSEVLYSILVQRDSYDLEILSADYSTTVAPGDVFPVTVVVKNVGYNRLYDNYVVVSIPALGISTQGYLGDLIPVEDLDTENDNDEEDSAVKTVYLQVPVGVEGGLYDIVIEAYDEDGESSVAMKKVINIDGSGSIEALATTKNKNIGAGESTTYEIILVNSGKSVEVVTLEAIFGESLSVSVPSAVAVGPESSAVVEVEVTASNDASLGAYGFTVNVNGNPVAFNANVSGESASTSAVVLTVILVILFVVLLAILIALLARRERPVEEVETSYY